MNRFIVVFVGVVAALFAEPASYASTQMEPKGSMTWDAFRFEKSTPNSKEIGALVRIDRFISHNPKRKYGSVEIGAHDSVHSFDIQFSFTNYGNEPIQINRYRDSAFVLSKDGKKYVIDFVNEKGGAGSYASETINPNGSFSGTVRPNDQDVKLISNLIDADNIDTLVYRFGSKYEIVFEELKAYDPTVQPGSAKT